MFYAGKVCFLFLCFTRIPFEVSCISIEDNNEVLNSIQSYVDISPAEDVFHLNVHISTPNALKTPMKIYKWNDNTINFSDLSLAYKLNVLYICLSCEFGYWMKNKLYDLIKGMPIFYHIEFINTDYAHEAEFHFEKFEEKLNTIEDHVNKFLRILKILISVEPHIVLTNETAFLHALYSLKFKIKYYKQLYQNDVKNNLINDRRKIKSTNDNDDDRECTENVENNKFTHDDENSHIHSENNTFTIINEDVHKFTGSREKDKCTHDVEDKNAFSYENTDELTQSDKSGQNRLNNYEHNKFKHNDKDDSLTGNVDNKTRTHDIENNEISTKNVENNNLTYDAKKNQSLILSTVAEYKELTDDFGNASQMDEENDFSFFSDDDDDQFKTFDDKRTFTDDVIVRECFDIINMIESFILSSCKPNKNSSPQSLTDHKRLYGYSINLTNFENFDKFFKSVTDLNFQLLSQKLCTKENMLVKSIFDDNDDEKSNNKLSDAIKNATVSFTKEYKIVTIRNIFLHAIESPDSKLIYFYLKSVLNTILTITQEIIEKLSSNPETFQSKHFRSFLEKLKINSEKMPKALVEYFCYVSLNLLLSPDEEINNLKFDESEFSIVQLPKWTTSPSLVDLEEFIDAIKQHDFQCFNDLLDILSVEYETYYLPFRKLNVSQLIDLIENQYDSDTENQKGNDIDNKYSYSSNECDYMDIVYSYCVELSISLNNASSYEQDTEKREQHAFLANLKFQRIKKIFSLTLKSNISENAVLRIIYNALITMINMKTIEASSYMANFERFLFRLMTSLDGYVLKHCLSPNNRLGMLLYQNLDISSIGKRSAIKLTMSQILNIPPNLLNDNSSTPDQTFMSIDHIFRKHIENSNTFIIFKNIVKYCWKGERKTLDKIYEDAISTSIINSQLLYAFYDGFFKFVIAAYYYEIDLFAKLAVDDPMMSRANIDLFKSNVILFSNEYFPEYLKPVIENLKQFAKYVVSWFLNTDKKPIVESISTEFKNKMEELHIVFNQGAVKNKPIFNGFWESKFGNSKKIKIDLEIVINELSSTVKKVFQCYSKLLSIADHD